MLHTQWTLMALNRHDIWCLTKHIYDTFILTITDAPLLYTVFKFETSIKHRRLYMILLLHLGDKIEFETKLTISRAFWQMFVFAFVALHLDYNLHLCSAINLISSHVEKFVSLF